MGYSYLEFPSQCPSEYALVPQVLALLAYLDGAGMRSARTPVERLLISRDALAFLFMMVSSVRGNNCARLETSELFTRPFAGAPLQLAALPLPSPIPSGFQLVVRTRGDKTRQCARSDDMVLAMGSPRPLEQCFLQRLSSYLLEWGAAHNGQCLAGPLFRPLNRPGTAFSSSALSTESLLSRLKMHLAACGLLSGETLHSFRRGSLQAACHAAEESAVAVIIAARAAGGAAAAAVLPSPEAAGRAAAAAAGQILTPRVVEVYLNPIRHEPRLKRAATGAAAIAAHIKRRNGWNGSSLRLCNQAC